LNINAAISQSGITNLKQLDQNGIIDLVSGNQLTGFISDGPFQGPIIQTYYKNGKYETIFEDKVFKGIWKVEGKRFLTKNNNASDFGLMYWYTGNKDGGTYAYIIAQGKIFHQYHEIKSVVQIKAEAKKEAQRKKVADAKKAEEKKKAVERKRVADAKKAEEKKKEAERKRVADAKKAEEKKKAVERKRVADAKKAEEKKKAVERKRVADAKKALRIAQEKLEEKKKEAERKRVAEEKIIAEENKKIALLPTQTEFQNAQHFLRDIQKYIASNKDEFDFFEIVRFTKNTKLIAEGISDDEQLKNIRLFKEFVQSSSTFLEFQKNRQDNRKISELSMIDTLIDDANNYFLKLKSFSKENLSSTSKNALDEKIKSSQLIINNPKTFAELENTQKDLRLFLSDLQREVEKTISTKDENKKIRKEFNAESLKVDENINNLKTYYVENMNTISTDLTDLILDQVTLLQNTKKSISPDNMRKALIELLKVNKEISSFKLDNNLLTSDEVAAIKKAASDKNKVEADRKRAADKNKADKKKADAKRKADAKEAKRLKNFKTVKLTCIYDRLYNFGSLFLDEAEQKWKYDGENIYLNGTLLKEGIKMRGTGGNRIILKKLTKQDAFKTSVYVGMNGETLMFTQEIDFDNKESFMNFEGRVDDGTCFPW